MKKPEVIFSRDNKYLISLLASVLAGKEPPKPNDKTDWASVFCAAYRHSVAGMTYYAVSKLPLESRPPEDIFQKFLSAYREELILEGNIQFETERLLADLTSKGISVMPLKGYILKNDYPVPAMRTMSDVDILYKSEDKDKLIDEFEKSGYTLQSDALGELDFTKPPFYHYEAHSCLVKINDSYYDYFSNVWDKALYQKNSVSAYMTVDDFYIYLIQHLAHHIENGGAGLRMIMDVFVFLSKHKNELDEAYLNEEFVKLHLFDFRKKAEEIAYNWFSTDEPDVHSPCADFILKCPTFGLSQNAIVYNSLKEERQKGKKRSGIMRLLSRIFPSYYQVCHKFSVANKHKFLYPFLVPAYWFSRLFRDKNVSVSSVKNYMKSTDSQEARKLAEITEDFGLLSRK